jgi:hypothetical protein
MKRVKLPKEWQENRKALTRRMYKSIGLESSNMVLQVVRGRLEDGLRAVAQEEPLKSMPCEVVALALYYIADTLTEPE